MRNEMKEGGTESLSGFERSLSESVKKLAEEEFSRLDFYRDFDESVPPAGEMFERSSAADPAVEKDAGGRRRQRFSKRTAWIASSSVAAAVAAILLVTTVYPHGAPMGDGGSVASTVETSADASAGGESAKSEAPEVVNEVRTAALPAKQTDYDGIYTALSESPGTVLDSAAAAAEGVEDSATGGEKEIAAPGNEEADSASEVPAASDTAGAPDSAAEEAQAPKDDALGTGAPEFSDTNVQTEGVQEADVVKTDGRYIYTANSKSVCITDSNGGRPEVLSEIPQVTDDGQVYFEMYINGDVLVLIRQGYSNITEKDGGAEKPSARGGIDHPGSRLMIDTSVDIYDVSDRENPRRTGSLSQSGGYANSRMVGGKLYLVSTYSDFDYDAMDKEDPRTFVPLYAEDGKQAALAPGDVYIPENMEYMSYTVVSGIDTSTAKFVSHESLLGENYGVYASRDSLYLYVAKYDAIEVKRERDYFVDRRSGYTQITRLSMKGGRVEVLASADVPGTVNDQFSLDEHEGALRVVTTKDESIYAEFSDEYESGGETGYSEEYYQDGGEASDKGGGAAEAAHERNVRAIEKEYGKLVWPSWRYGYGREMTTGLYVLDMDLNLLGKVDDLAPGEQVYSCRYMGDVAYFVTFRNTDPLFSVDLSDPERPEVMGKLKIPGFSEYLHPYADGLLFGLGSDADEKTGEVKSLKVSMFDNSDPYDVKEKDKLLIDGMNYTYAADNHKAVLVDARKSLVAFPAADSYVILRYDEGKGFSRVMDVSLDPAGDGDVQHRYAGLRGLFIGDVFYVIAPDSIHTYDMLDGFKAIDSVSLGSGARYVDKDSYELPPGYDYEDVYGDIPVRAFPE